MEVHEATLGVDDTSIFTELVFGSKTPLRVSKPIFLCALLRSTSYWPKVVSEKLMLSTLHGRELHGVRRCTLRARLASKRIAYSDAATRSRQAFSTGTTGGSSGGPA